MADDEWTINSEEQKKQFIKRIEEQWGTHKYLVIKVKTGKQRTSTQNAAMHKYFSLLSQSLNDAGYTVARFFNRPIEMSWTPNLVKDLIWRKIQLAKYPDINSTSKLERNQVSEIYDEINKFMIEHRNIEVHFPSNQK
jgi:hypothetical protein